MRNCSLRQNCATWSIEPEEQPAAVGSGVAFSKGKVFTGGIKYLGWSTGASCMPSHQKKQHSLEYRKLRVCPGEGNPGTITPLGCVRFAEEGTRWKAGFWVGSGEPFCWPWHGWPPESRCQSSSVNQSLKDLKKRDWGGGGVREVEDGVQDRPFSHDVSWHVRLRMQF